MLFLLEINKAWLNVVKHINEIIKNSKCFLIFNRAFYVVDNGMGSLEIENGLQFFVGNKNSFKFSSEE